MISKLPSHLDEGYLHGKLKERVLYVCFPFRCSVYVAEIMATRVLPMVNTVQYLCSTCSRSDTEDMQVLTLSFQDSLLEEVAVLPM